jgi:hypothetical protein
VTRPAENQQTETRCDRYRDLLEAWTAWWNNIGRYNFTYHIIPPLTETSEALACLACHGLTELDVENGPDRCQVCGRRVP